MTHSTKHCSSIFDLGPLTPKIYSPNFAKKSPITLLVGQTDRRCLSIPGGFRGWPIQWNHAKCCGPTLVAMAMKFGLGVVIQSPTGLLSLAAWQIRFLAFGELRKGKKIRDARQQ